jgi:hypothetical protein
MLNMDSPTDELESIISLSAAPLVDLSLVIDNIKDHVSYYQNLPTIAKPFLKRDLPSISNLEEQEWLDMLNIIKANLEEINSAASNILGKSPSLAPENKPMPKAEKIKKIKRKKTVFNSVVSLRTKEDKSLSNVILTLQEKKIIKGATIYCPECGHKCNGKRGLKVHIYAIHNEIREEMLKTFEL